MRLIIKTAFKNIIGNGKRTWLNVAVLSFTLILMIAYMGIIDGWLEEARNDTYEWETCAGQIWHPEYDRFDVFTLQDAHGVIPPELNECTKSGSAVPVLVLQGSIFPKGRMQNILIKGISASQQILKLPTDKLETNNHTISAMIGTRMAKSADLKVGDSFMLRWRDKNGVFDAREIVISYIFYTQVPAIDTGQIWIDLDDLYEMTGMDSEATYLVRNENCPVHADISGWLYKDNQFLMTDLAAIEQTARAEAAIIFVILLSIALLAVFDTQMLSIFRRQKEIGTYVALGMTPRKVTGLFTVEGTAYSILSVFVTIIIGTPFFIWFAHVGIPMPDAYEEVGVTLGTSMTPVFKVSTMMTIIAVVIFFSALISYLPARKISRQNMVLALKGKIN